VPYLDALVAAALLIATLPLVFSLGDGSLGGMPLVVRQQHELWLTAAQSLFALVLVAEFALGRWEAVALLVPFVAQLVLPPSVGGLDVRMGFTVAYVLAALALLLDSRRTASIRGWPSAVRGLLKPDAPHPSATPVGDIGGFAP
jgi:cation:H+ antiporter